MDSELHHGPHHQHGSIDVTWAYSPEDIAPAQGALALIVGDQPKRVLMLDAVVRWPETAWTALDGKLSECGFERTKPVGWCGQTTPNNSPTHCTRQPRRTVAAKISAKHRRASLSSEIPRLWRLRLRACTNIVLANDHFV